MKFLKMFLILWLFLGLFGLNSVSAEEDIDSIDSYEDTDDDWLGLSAKDLEKKAGKPDEIIKDGVEPFESVYYYDNEEDGSEEYYFIKKTVTSILCEYEYATEEEAIEEVADLIAEIEDAGFVLNTGYDDESDEDDALYYNQKLKEYVYIYTEQDENDGYFYLAVLYSKDLSLIDDASDFLDEYNDTDDEADEEDEE